MERWLVRWTKRVPVVGGEHRHDLAECGIRHFATEAAAVAFALSMTEADYYGAPSVWLMRSRIFNPCDGGPRMMTWDRVREVEVFA